MIVEAAEHVVGCWTHQPQMETPLQFSLLLVHLHPLQWYVWTKLLPRSLKTLTIPPNNKFSLMYFSLEGLVVKQLFEPLFQPRSVKNTATGRPRIYAAMPNVHHQSEIEGDR